MSDPSAFSVLASAAAVALAGVLGAAAAAKRVRPAETVSSFRDLGLRRPEILAVAVPVVELAVAIGCLVWPRIGGWGAFFLLATFTALLLSVVRSGRKVSCRCFGAMSTAPVSGATIARNIVLTVGALATASIDRLVGGLATVLAAAGLLGIGALGMAMTEVRHTTGRLI